MMRRTAVFLLVCLVMFGCRDGSQREEFNDADYELISRKSFTKSAPVKQVTVERIE